MTIVSNRVFLPAACPFPFHWWSSQWGNSVIFQNTCFPLYSQPGDAESSTSYLSCCSFPNLLFPTGSCDLQGPCPQLGAQSCLSALVLRSTMSVPDLSHAQKSLCFSFLYKGLEQVPQSGQPEEKNFRTRGSQRHWRDFLPVRGSMINLKRSPTVAHVSTVRQLWGKQATRYHHARAKS